MSLDKATVASIANLARIKVPDDRLEAMVGDLNAILGFVEQLDEVDTSGVEPLASVTGHTLPQREDAVTDGGYQARVTANAPESAHGFFVVPKVVE
ncbi:MULTISPECIES: Asp-tRNA(Asn)/Glu-tRNA(Gln) amidotransferase subunit GatC [Thalassobaculum]|uniref:Aspartyl/glutamyl-tRNA(Asn/Gln) amidotransferase subunit C n=1 Tax=Thalassobaculum litoreum DSM 18839 TaxID=1123362 RepID=A0A8G2F589_9PROT|nr:MULTISPECIES: Asp-tRNA(Asn)/Glu-tRNA(Gln) amidotransferase subunit GatC [Thalassobaculum]SDG43149.1 aspartyl/glutamyl-tRNA(Asn/Gln) amidotransferase subunit C [Thalassobaculum litoreum DSM 18839]